MNTKRKGDAGERELIALLQARGYSAYRGQAIPYTKGGADTADVIALPGVHIECKRVEKLNIHAAMRQAVNDCGSLTPIVVHRKNREEWLVTQKFTDWLNMYGGQML
jgi:Holliday junction resolvase